MRQHRHLGAYGVTFRHGQVLLIQKARGPYVGRWDLPGGGVEFGESPEEAVRREFLEETGLQVIGAEVVRVCDTRLVYTLPDGTEEDLHHIGLIYRVSVAPAEEPRAAPDGSDSLGARWCHLGEVDPALLSPFARECLERIEP